MNKTLKENFQKQIQMEIQHSPKNWNTQINKHKEIEKKLEKL